MKDVSLVVPLFNEEESLPELCTWIDRVCQENNLSYEVLLLDDGSTDNSWAVIEEIAQKNSVDITFTNGSGDVKPKKADTINADLVKANVYNILDQKQITAWLDLRNKAAHGQYEKYDLSQVQLMYQGVLNFIIRLNN
jgi:glycosyltransferase involved in cell wall biosynthesis